MTKKNEFNVGDKVKVIKTSWNDYIQVGMIGTVKHIHPSGQPRIGVEFDKYVDGHTLSVDCGVPRGHGWYMNEEEIEVIDSKSTEPKEEKMNEFKLGDIVEVIDSVHDRSMIQIGMRAKVKNFNCKEENVGLEFFENIDGHTLKGDAKEGYGWYVNKSVVELVDDSVVERPEKITVYLEGTRTTVVLEDGSTGTSNLMHGDTYSVEKGIEIAKAKALIARKTKERDTLVEKGNEMLKQIDDLIMERRDIVGPIPTLNIEIADLQEKINVIGG
ncbi:hypothetical protein AAXB25_15160 [Paenibacillus lautus]|uniref:hypothetical protein n=1 Tax=Paenibacillus lautus TaxID=1401 RepID=UPI003D2E038A